MLYQILLITVCLFSSVVQASSNPRDLSLKYLGTDPYEPDENAVFRFYVNPSWGTHIRVSIGHGGTAPIQTQSRSRFTYRSLFYLFDGERNATFATTENRFFFVPKTPSEISSHFDIQAILASDEEIKFVDVTGEADRKRFGLEMKVGRYR